MPVFPGLFEKLSILKNDEPGFLLDLAGTQGFRALCTAQKLGIFDSLHPEPLTADEIASRLGLNLRGTTLLLEALESLGYLELKDEKYKNSKISNKWLLKSSPSSFASTLQLYSSLVFEFSELLEYTIREGKSHFTLHEWLRSNEETDGDSQEFLLTPAQFSTKEIADKIDLPSTAKLMLDISYNRGIYSRELCRRHPELRSVVLESPLSNTAEKDLTDEFNGRISIHRGSFINSLPEESFDAVLLFNLLHRNDTATNESLLSNIEKILNPGAKLIIIDQLLDQAAGPAAKAFSRLQSLTLFNASGGQIYSFQEISDWLQKAGFTQIERKKLSTAPLFGLIYTCKNGALN